MKIPAWFHFKEVGRCRHSLVFPAYAYVPVPAVHWRAPEIKPPDQWGTFTRETFAPNGPGTVNAFQRLTYLARNDVPKQPTLSDL
jgi:hypothetical protein